MNVTSLRIVTIFSSLSVLAILVPGCTTYVQSPPPPAVVEQPVPVYVAAPPPPPQQEYVPPAPEPVPVQPVYVAAPAPREVVEIHSESDFYEPLAPYGRWIDVDGYGRCWAPANVDPDWRPYTSGHWERTDAGWYWVSDEPWGWATCHYGRWFLDPNLGWVWVPQTQWAPAWVAWREGGGYTGWAPLPPRARIREDGGLENPDQDIEPHSFVFVEKRKMLEPQRPQTVIINNTTIVQQTVNITKIVVVNKTVINEGPAPESVASVTGHRVDVVPSHTLRTRQEAPAVAAHHLHTAGQSGSLPPPTQRTANLNESENHNRQTSEPSRTPPVTASETYSKPQPGGGYVPPNQPQTQTRPEEVRPQPGQPIHVVNPDITKPATHHHTNSVVHPLPEANKPGLPAYQPRPEPNQPSGQSRPELNAHSNVPGQHGNETLKPGQAPLTPHQKTESERQKKGAEKQHHEGEKPQPPYTNAPAPVK